MDKVEVNGKGAIDVSEMSVSSLIQKLYYTKHAELCPCTFVRQGALAPLEAHLRSNGRCTTF